MTHIPDVVNSLGGMAQKQQLVARGARDLDLTRSVRIGEVVRARQGWYTTLPALDPAVRAVRVGGRLTGISSIAARGGWVLGAHPLHVSVPINAARLRTQSNRFRRLQVNDTRGVVLHWDAPELSERGTVLHVPLTDALVRVILDEPLEVAVAALDWALRTRQLNDTEFEALILQLPECKRFTANWVDSWCDSLPESLARTRLRLAGHHVISQVLTPGKKPIDLVVDEIVGLEIDGEEHHLLRFEADRRKDIEITLMGLHAIRPSARMVFYDWPELLRAIEAAIDARRAARTAEIQESARSGWPGSPRLLSISARMIANS